MCHISSKHRSPSQIIRNAFPPITSADGLVSSSAPAGSSISWNPATGWMQNIQGVQAVSQGGQGMTAVSVGPTAYGTFQTMQGAQTGAGTQGLQTMQTMQTMPMQAAQSQYIIQLAHVSPHLLAMATSPALSPAIASLQHTPQLPTKSFFPLNVQLLSPPTQPAQTPSLATLPFSADAAQTSDPFLGSLLQGTDTATPNPEYEIDLDEILNTTEEDNSAESDFFSQLQSAPSLTSASAALAEPIFPYPSFSPPTTSFTAPPPFPAYSVPSASPSLATPALASGRRRSQAVPQVLSRHVQAQAPQQTWSAVPTGPVVAYFPTVAQPPSSDPTRTSPSLSLTSTSPLSTFSSGSSRSSFSQRGSATPTTQLAAYPSSATNAGSAYPILALSSAKGQVRALGIRRPGPPAALGNEPRGTKRSVSGLDHEDGERDNFDEGRKCKVQAHGRGHHDTVYHEGHADGGDSAHLQDKEGFLLLDAGYKSPLTLPIPAPGHGLRDDPLRTADPALLAALLAPVRRRRRRTEEEDVVDEDTKKRRSKNTEAARRSRLRKSLALAQLELRVNSLTASNEALQARAEQLEKERDEWRRRAEARKDELGQWEEKIEELHGEMNARGIVVPSAEAFVAPKVVVPSSDATPSAAELHSGGDIDFGLDDVHGTAESDSESEGDSQE